MKVIAIRGGLGNQLFGLAFAHSIATITGNSVGLDVSGFDRDRYGHRFMLGDLAARLGLRIGRHPVLASRFVAAALGALPGTPWIREGAAPPGREALAAMAKRGAWFDGYWQNEAYIAEPDVVRPAVRAFLAERGGASRTPTSFDGRSNRSRPTAARPAISASSQTIWALPWSGWARLATG